MNEKEIMKIVKNVEGRLAIHMLDEPGYDDLDRIGYFASVELEEAILKELKNHGEERAINIINSCNRWD